MGQQSIRHKARRTTLGVQSKRRAERAERQKWLEDLVVRVLVAVRERDAALADADRRVGKALREMTDEGLSVPEAVEWCGDEITTRGDAAASPRRGRRGRQELDVWYGGRAGTEAAREGAPSVSGVPGS
jgi:hypothetical protein